MTEDPQRQSGKSPRQRAQKLEVQGLLIIAVLLLIFVVVRYWHNISWSVR